MYQNLNIVYVYCLVDTYSMKKRETGRGENVFFWFVIFFSNAFFFNLIFKYSFDQYLSRAVINLTVELSKSKLNSYEHGLNFTHKMQNYDSFFLKRGYENLADHANENKLNNDLLQQHS